MGNKILPDFARRFFLVLTLSFGLFGAGQDYSSTNFSDNRDVVPVDYSDIKTFDSKPIEALVLDGPTPITSIILSNFKLQLL
jgi:hypothetical protein